MDPLAPASLAKYFRRNPLVLIACVGILIFLVVPTDEAGVVPVFKGWSPIWKLGADGETFRVTKINALIWIVEWLVLATCAALLLVTRVRSNHNEEGGLGAPGKVAWTSGVDDKLGRLCEAAIVEHRFRVRATRQDGVKILTILATDATLVALVRRLSTPGTLDTLAIVGAYTCKPEQVPTLIQELLAH